METSENQINWRGEGQRGKGIEKPLTNISRGVKEIIQYYKNKWREKL